MGVGELFPHGGVDGGQTAAEVVAVDDVIVDEEGSVQQVHAGTEDGGGVQPASADLTGGDMHQAGAQVLAAQGRGGHALVGQGQQARADVCGGTAAVQELCEHLQRGVDTTVEVGG